MTLSNWFIAATTLLSAAAGAAPLPNVTSIALAWEHGCAIVSPGQLKCWGGNLDGSLGDGSGTQQLSPVDVSGLSSGVAAVAANRATTCALTIAGAMKCWGENNFGQAGGASSSTPKDVPGLSSGVVAMGVADQHTCAVVTGGGLKCWGRNSDGELGNGTMDPFGLGPVDVYSPTTSFAAVAGGFGYTCALTTTGGVKCWGRNGSGQLGDGTQTWQPPTDVVGLGSGSGATAIAAGAAHACAITAAGGVKCWGSNSSWQLGDGTTTNRLTPVDVPGLTSGVTSIAAGFEHTCAVKDGAVLCWGSNARGQLGDGGDTPHTTPTPVVGLASGVLSVVASSSNTCVRTNANYMMCWGDNSYGQLGNGTIYPVSIANRPLPEFVGSLTQQTLTFGALPNRDVNEPAFTVSASASSGLPVTFTSITPSVCSVSGSTVTLVAIGLCRIAADQLGDTDFIPARRIVRTFLVSGNLPSSPQRLANISTRALVQNGNDVLIGGFVVRGPASKTVVITATGPSLAAAGIANPLANPTIRLVRASDQRDLAVNDNWQDDQFANLIQSIGLAPSDPLESAVLATLEPGAYTVVVSGVGGGTGVGLVGVYEIDNVESPLINVSTRGQVLTGNDVMIGGFVIQGTSSQTVAVVGYGPSLANAGIGNPLANPTLTLVRSSDGMVIGSNDDWQTSGNAAQVTAAGFAPSHPMESVIMMTLPPGAYTAILSGVANGTGIGVVAVYAVP